MSTNKENIIALLEHHYPSAYDIQTGSDGGQLIYIKWEEFTISNSNGNSHTIKDFFLRINVNNTFNRFISFQGVRCTATLKEIHSNYMHSHCGSSELGSFGRMCTGSTILSDLMAMLASSEFCIELFEMFLVQLDLYVRWESLEGGPYRKIEHLNYKSISSHTNPTFQTAMLLKSDYGKQLLNLIAPFVQISEVDSSFERQYIFSFNTKIEKIIALAFEKVPQYRQLMGISDVYPIIEVKNEETEEYFALNSGLNEFQVRQASYYEYKTQFQRSGPVFTFKGEPIFKKVLEEGWERSIDSVEEDLTNGVKVINRNISNAIINELNKQSKFYIKNKLYESYRHKINAGAESSTITA